MSNFEDLKILINKKYSEKQAEIEKHCMLYGETYIPLGSKMYRAEGWRDCLDYLLAEIRVIENAE